jgi:hypothetical protein
MDSARPVTQRILNPHFVSQKTSFEYDVASTIQHNAFEPLFPEQTASYDVASTVHWSLPHVQVRVQDERGRGRHGELSPRR